MPTYYIDNCERVKEVPSKHGGSLVIYNLTLKNEEGTYQAELAQRPNTPEPSGTIEGTIRETEFGAKFSKVKPQGTGELRTEYVGGKTPEQQKSIVRQHSQHMALIYIALVQKKEPEVTLNRDYVKGIIDWFQEDAEA